MGVTKTLSSRWLALDVRQTDFALFFVCAFVMIFNLLVQWLSGEQILRMPTLALKRAPLVLLPLLIWVANIVALMMRRKYGKPLRVIWRLLRRDPLWIIRAIILFSVIAASAPAYSAFKHHIPTMVPYYADPAIAKIESAMFGQDPWRITHAIFGLYGTILLDRLYIVWFPISTFTVTWAIMSRSRIFQTRSIMTLFFVWFILGNFVALALSSCGPVYYEHFYGDDNFAPLVDMLRSYNAKDELAVIRASDWLISDKALGNLGSGISAMPSVHVGVAFVTWLLVQSRIGWKNAISVILAVYVAAIWIASVHLAWHYWLDGAVSILGAAIFWKATGYFLPSDRALRPALPPKSKYQPQEAPGDLMAVEPTPTVQP